MKENDIIKAIGNIDDSFIEEAAPNGFVKKKSPGFTLGLMGRWAGAFAVFVLAAVLVINGIRPFTGVKKAEDVSPDPAITSEGTDGVSVNAPQFETSGKDAVFELNGNFTGDELALIAGTDSSLGEKETFLTDKTVFVGTLEDGTQCWGEYEGNLLNCLILVRENDEIKLEFAEPVPADTALEIAGKVE